MNAGVLNETPYIITGETKALQILSETGVFLFFSVISRRTKHTYWKCPTKKKKNQHTKCTVDTFYVTAEISYKLLTSGSSRPVKTVLSDKEKSVSEMFCARPISNMGYYRFV